MFEAKEKGLPQFSNEHVVHRSTTPDRHLEALVLNNLPREVLGLVSNFISDGMMQESKLMDRSPEWVSGKLIKGEGIVVVMKSEDEDVPWDDDARLADFLVNHYAACAFLEKRLGVMSGVDIVEICGVYTNSSLRRNAHQSGPKIGAGTEAFATAIMRARQVFPETAIVSWVHPMGSLQALTNAVGGIDHLRLVPDEEFVGHEDILDPEHKPYEVIE